MWEMSAWSSVRNDTQSGLGVTNYDMPCQQLVETLCYRNIHLHQPSQQYYKPIKSKEEKDNEKGHNESTVVVNRKWYL